MSKNDRYVVRRGGEWAVKKPSREPRTSLADLAGARFASRGAMAAGAIRTLLRRGTIRTLLATKNTEFKHGAPGTDPFF
jgi:hypothetical protein